MITYLIIGIIFAIGVEILKDWLVQHKLYPLSTSGDPFDIWARLFIVLLWPLGLIWFIVGFINGYNNKG